MLPTWQAAEPFLDTDNHLVGLGLQPVPHKDTRALKWVGGFRKQAFRGEKVLHLIFDICHSARCIAGWDVNQALT